MTKETTINNLLERQECRIYVTLKFAGVAVNTDDFDVYGSATDGRCSSAFSVTTTEKAGQFLVTIPALSIGRSAAYTYQLCARRKSSGHEWVVLHGTIDLTARVADIKASKINIPEKVIEVTLEPESELPPEYTPLEYIENVRGKTAFIYLPIDLNQAAESLDIEAEQIIFAGGSQIELARERDLGGMRWGVGGGYSETFPNHYIFKYGETSSPVVKGPRISSGYKVFKASLFNGHCKMSIDGETVFDSEWSEFSYQISNYTVQIIGVFCIAGPGEQMDLNGMLYGRKKYFKVWKNDILFRNLIPCLDDTGTPCMFDTVHQVPFFSSGKDDFTFPQQAEPAAEPFSRRRPVTYAKLTAHGVRRLYTVPSGYNGTKEEYAAEYGFKPLVETPQPEEGYWSPQWRETEEEIVLDWVETEPPEELETLNQ